MSDEANHARHCARVAREWASEETGDHADGLLLSAEVAEREAVALDAGVDPDRARVLAHCEAHWRRGAACVCGLHTTEAP